MSWLIGLVAVVVLGFLGLMGLNLFLVWRLKRREGKPAPELSGRPGKMMRRKGGALFYFYSPGCSACRATTPVIQRMARSDDRVFPVDVSRDMATARKFGVMATPTTILVRNGLLAKVVVGPQSEEMLRGLWAA